MRTSTLLLCLSLAACNASPAPAKEPAGETAPKAEALPATAPAANPHDPHAAPSAAAPTGPAQAGGLTWDAELPLERQAPKSSMRAAQYGVQGDAQAELSVFYFGADQGGSVEANITRWLGQIKQPDGSDTTQKAKRGEKKVNGLTVSLVEATGAFGGGMAMPGAPAPTPITDALMLGAIAQGPEGSVFFKLVGPRETVERARTAFDGMLASLRPATP
jgi:hypothetical protein